MSVLRKSTKRISNLKGLHDAGLLSKDDPDSALNKVAQHYAIGITPQIIKTMRSAGMNDPLARQFIPDLAELKTLPQEEHDPIGDDAHSPVKGIVHRYPDRVLFKVTSACAVYCRYCFRREMVGKGEKPLSEKETQEALDYINEKPQIREVILTGGDPFILSVRNLRTLFENLSTIPHLDIIRIHTRIPASDPSRITADVCALLNETKKAVYIAIHVNHVQEINDDVRKSVRRLHDTGAVLLSQSVLLKGVNDDPKILEQLYRALLKLKVKPYYLHHPDLARGTSHFRLSLTEGMKIHRALLGRLSGLAQPAYMLDIPGGTGKVPVNASYIEDLGGGRYSVTDYQGGTHIYEDPLE